MSAHAVKLSVLVIAYKMPRQALNTVYSLSAAHQQNVRESDYEIVVVENESSDNIPEQELLALGNNIRYFRRQETSASPCRAVNFGLQQCRGKSIGLMIDGARMVTPRVIEYALLAQHADADSLLAIPGYNLGPMEHQYHLDQWPAA